MVRKVYFFVPSMFSLYGESGKYPAVSITGEKCELDCKHCSAHILKTMPDASTPEKLIELARQYDAEGCVGMLVSGGSDLFGKLPWEPFVDALKWIKANTKLFVSVHSGFVDTDQAKLLKSSGVDQALIDVIGSDEVAQKVYNLPSGIAKSAVEALFESGIEVVPHVLVGLNFGENSGEEQAVELIAKYNPKIAVIIALRPSKHTPMGSVVPPSPQRVAEVIAHARRLLPKTFINLGCARPVGKLKAEMDVLAIRAGVDGLAVPSRQAEEEAEKLGLEVIKKPTCCSMISLAVPKLE